MYKRQEWSKSSTIEYRLVSNGLQPLVGSYYGLSYESPLAKVWEFLHFRCTSSLDLLIISWSMVMHELALWLNGASRPVLYSMKDQDEGHIVGVALDRLRGSWGGAKLNYADLLPINSVQDQHLASKSAVYEFQSLHTPAVSRRQ